MKANKKIRSTAIVLIAKSKINHSYHVNGNTTQVHHIIQRVLIIFDQTIHQIAISVFFLTAAIILAANSGKLVQIAIIVTPINELGTQKLDAIDTALSTINFHQRINQDNHKMIKITDFEKVIIFISLSSSQFLFFEIL